MNDMKPSKADLIAELVGKGLGTHVSLQRLTLAGLQAMADEAATPAAGTLTLAAEDVLPGDEWMGGICIHDVRAGSRWVWFQARNGDWFMQILRGVQVTVTRLPRVVG